MKVLNKRFVVAAMVSALGTGWGLNALAAEKELVIGVNDALTGPGAVYGLPQSNAVQMAAEEIRTNAQAEAARILAQAKEDADQQVSRAREILRLEVAALAVQGAEQILQREVDAKSHAALLEQLKAQL